MIKIKYIKHHCRCSNCQRKVPVVLKYNINHTEIKLCEDCSQALGDLHRNCMEKGEPYKYYKDEIVREEI